MFANFPQMPGFGANPFEVATAATTSATTGLRAIATEMTDYSKRSFEKNCALFEKMAGVKKFDEALKLQSDFAKSAYEDFIAEAAKMGEIYSNLAKGAFKPTNG